MVTFGRITLIIGLIVTAVSLIVGFALMFMDYDGLAIYFLMAIPFGFVILFTGVSTVVMFSPREIELQNGSSADVSEASKFKL